MEDIQERIVRLTSLIDNMEKQDRSRFSSTQWNLYSAAWMLKGELEREYNRRSAELS